MQSNEYLFFNYLNNNVNTVYFLSLFVWKLGDSKGIGIKVIMPGISKELANLIPPSTTLQCSL